MRLNQRALSIATVCLLSASAAVPGVVAAQAEPEYSFPSAGSELVMIFISDSRCTGNAEERLDDAVRQAKLDLANRYEPQGHTFYSIGAAAEWSVEEGVDYLLDGVSPGYSDKDFGPWDEVWAGRSWLNNAAIEHIWRGDRESVVPQLIVLRRDVVQGATGFDVGRNEVVARAVGSAAIVDWLDNGAPLSIR